MQDSLWKCVCLFVLLCITCVRVCLVCFACVVPLIRVCDYGAFCSPIVSPRLLIVCPSADQLQELSSRRALDLVEMRAESERRLMECTGSMIHSTEELHGQIELLKGALLKKAEELQTLKEIHQKCPGNNRGLD